LTGKVGGASTSTRWAQKAWMAHNHLKRGGYVNAIFRWANESEELYLFSEHQDDYDSDDGYEQFSLGCGKGHWKRLGYGPY